MQIYFFNCLTYVAFIIMTINMTDEFGRKWKQTEVVPFQVF